MASAKPLTGVVPGRERWGTASKDSGNGTRTSEYKCVLGIK